MQLSKGKNTSELWVVLLGMVLSVGLPLLEAAIPRLPEGSIWAAAAPALLAGLYAVIRWRLKNEQLQATAQVETAKIMQQGEPAKFDPGAILEAARQEAQRVATERAIGFASGAVGLGFGEQGTVEHSEISGDGSGEPLPEYSEPVELKAESE